MVSKNKAIGFLFLALAMIFLIPIPSFTDVITIPIYEKYSGVNVNMENLSSTYLDYFIWQMIVGIILLAIALYFLGWDLKMLMKKLDLGKYRIAVGLAVLSVILVSYLDVQGAIYWSSFSSVNDYTNGLQGPAFWEFFKSIAFSIFIIVPICYWFFVKKDFSETLSLFLTSIILWFFGLADVLYFVLQRINIPEILPHLNNHPIIGWVSTTLGFEQVTNISLLISVFIGFIVVFLTTKVLKERF